MRLSFHKIGIHDLTFVRDIVLAPNDEAFAGGPLPKLFENLALDDLTAEIHLFALAHDGRAVGFLMLREDDHRPKWADPNAITLHSLRISTALHGKGYGRSIIVHAARWISTHRSMADTMQLSVNKRNKAAYGFYRRIGFLDTGRKCSGRLGEQAILSAPIKGLVTDTSQLES